MSSLPSRAACHRALTLGTAIGATLGAAGLLAPEAQAVGVDVTPTRATAGTAPAFSLSWNRVSSGGSAITVTLSDFTTASDGTCNSGAVTLTIGASTPSFTCTYDPASRRFTLASTAPAFAPGRPTLGFPAGLIIVPGSGNGTFTVDGPGTGIGGTATVTVTPPSDTTSPVDGLAAHAPPDWMRQYQRAHQEEPCLPQWNPSYAMWANAGAGGWVCVQTEAWDNSLGRWVLR